VAGQERVRGRRVGRHRSAGGSTRSTTPCPRRPPPRGPPRAPTRTAGVDARGASRRRETRMVSNVESRSLRPCPPDTVSRHRPRSDPPRAEAGRKRARPTGGLQASLSLSECPGGS
jgi:hypothetical protein